jgi:hypothetical protein
MFIILSRVKNPRITPALTQPNGKDKASTSPDLSRADHSTGHSQTL